MKQLKTNGADNPTILLANDSNSERYADTEERYCNLQSNPVGSSYVDVAKRE